MSSKHFQFIQIVVGRRIKNNKNNKGMRKTEGNDSIIEDYIVALIHLFNFHSNFHCSKNGASRRSKYFMGCRKAITRLESYTDILHVHGYIAEWYRNINYFQMKIIQ